MLNKAHSLHRQAEKASRKGRVEEAIQLHKEAADILRDLLQTIINDKVAESVRLQAELHEKEKTILRQQRKRCQKVYKDLESLRSKMSEAQEAARDLQLVQIRNTDGTRSETPRSTTSRSSSRSKRRQSPHQSQERNYRAHSHQRQKVYEESTLQNSIYRKFEETETLLDQLRIQEGFGLNHPQAGSTTSGDDALTATASEIEMQRIGMKTPSGRTSAVPSLLAQGGTSSTHSNTPQHHHRCRKVSSASRSRSSSASRRNNTQTLPGALKRPKDDKIIIEELQIANCHLRKMVDNLFSELSICQQENFELKARVRLLEEQLAMANAVANNDELAIVARHREEVRLVNDQFVKKSLEVTANQYNLLSQDFITKNPHDEDSFMAKTTDIILSELESIDSTKMLTTQLQNTPIILENILTSNSSFSPPSSKESSEIAALTQIQPKMLPIQIVPTSQQSSSSEEEEPVTQRIIPTEELPPLPPLEMPSFDFSEGLLQQSAKTQRLEENIDQTRVDLSLQNELNKPEA